MRIYNDLQINEVFENVDTSTIRSDNSSLDLRKYDEASITRDSLDSDHKSITNSGDYATVGTFSISGSELNPDHNEMGSTIKLVSPKVQQVSFNHFLFSTDMKVIVMISIWTLWCNECTNLY